MTRMSIICFYSFLSFEKLTLEVIGFIMPLDSYYFDRCSSSRSSGFSRHIDAH
jgi:hypothetical protein